MPLINSTKRPIFQLKVKSLTRNQKHLALIERFHKRFSRNSNSPNNRKVLTKSQRTIQCINDPEVSEFFDWMFTIQSELGVNDAEFAQMLEITLRMFYFYKGRRGYIPSKKVYRRLLELERMCRISVHKTKDKTTFQKVVPVHLIIIE